MWTEWRVSCVINAITWAEVQIAGYFLYMCTIQGLKLTAYAHYLGKVVFTIEPFVRLRVCCSKRFVFTSCNR